MGLQVGFKEGQKVNIPDVGRGGPEQRKPPGWTDSLETGGAQWPKQTLVSGVEEVREAGGG